MCWAQTGPLDTLHHFISSPCQHLEVGDGIVPLVQMRKEIREGKQLPTASQRDEVDLGSAQVHL